MRELSEFVVWSNFFFLIPVWVLLASEHKLYALIVFLAMAVSVVYHLSNELLLGRLDFVLAIILISFNFWAILRNGFQGNMSEWLAVTFVPVSFYFYFRSEGKIGLNHGLWHLVSVIITLLSVLALVG